MRGQHHRGLRSPRPLCSIARHVAEKLSTSFLTKRGSAAFLSQPQQAPELSMEGSIESASGNPDTFSSHPVDVGVLSAETLAEQQHAPTVDAAPPWFAQPWQLPLKNQGTSQSRAYAGGLSHQDQHEVHTGDSHPSVAILKEPPVEDQGCRFVDVSRRQSLGSMLSHQLQQMQLPAQMSQQPHDVSFTNIASGQAPPPPAGASAQPLLQQLQQSIGMQPTAVIADAGEMHTRAISAAAAAAAAAAGFYLDPSSPAAVAAAAAGMAAAAAKLAAASSAEMIQAPSSLPQQQPRSYFAALEHAASSSSAAAKPTPPGVGSVPVFSFPHLSVDTHTAFPTMELQTPAKAPPAARRRSSVGSRTRRRSSTPAVATVGNAMPAAPSQGVLLPTTFPDEPASPDDQEDHSKRKYRYTEDEDRAILAYLDYAVRNAVPGAAGGNKLWKQMEAHKVTKHPWQSMRDHYLKILLPRSRNEIPKRRLKRHRVAAAARAAALVAQHHQQGLQALTPMGSTSPDAQYPVPATSPTVLTMDAADQHTPGAGGVLSESRSPVWMQHLASAVAHSLNATLQTPARFSPVPMQPHRSPLSGAPSPVAMATTGRQSTGSSSSTVTEVDAASVCVPPMMEAKHDSSVYSMMRDAEQDATEGDA